MKGVMILVLLTFLAYGETSRNSGFDPISRNSEYGLSSRDIGFGSIQTLIRDIRQVGRKQKNQPGGKTNNGNKMTKRKTEKKKKSSKKQAPKKKGLHDKANSKNVNQKNTVIVRGPKSEQLSSRQEECPDGVSNECLSNAMTLLTFEGGFRNNFIKQYDRFVKFNKTVENKDSKKFDFSDPASHMMMAIGGNTTNISSIEVNCDKGDNNTESLNSFVSIYNTLNNCSTFVTEYCSAYVIANGTWETMTECYDLLQQTKSLTEVCRKMSDSGAEQCACWQDLKTNHYDVYKNIKEPVKCNEMSKLAKAIRDHKVECVEAFKVCKKAEDASVALIYDCMNFGVDEEWNPVVDEEKVLAEFESE